MYASLRAPFHKWSCGQKTFNNFTPPPKRGVFFWGGGNFFWIISWNFEFGTKTFFWWDFGASRNFWETNQPISINSADLWLFEIQKVRYFQYFWANLPTFFFKMRFWAKLVLESLKMDFLRLFRSWRLEMVYIDFLSIFDLSKKFYAFFVLYYVVWPHNHLTCNRCVFVFPVFGV